MIAFYHDGIDMPVKFERAVFRSGNSYRITLPMPIVKTLGIEEKDVLEIWLDDSHIIIQKPEKTRTVETMDAK